MALINCPECQKEVSERAMACPYCGHPISEQQPEQGTEAVKSEEPRVLACRSCNVQMVAKQKRPFVSAGGLIGAFCFLVGLLVLFFHLIGGLLLMILGVILGIAGGGKKMVMVCPKCGAEGGKPAQSMPS